MRVVGVRIVDGKVTDVQEATAMSRNIDKVDVFSASWGPKDDGGHLEGPARLTRRALQDGVTMVSARVIKHCIRLYYFTVLYV